MAKARNDELEITQETVCEMEQGTELKQKTELGQQAESEQEAEQAENKQEKKSAGGSIFTGIYDQLPDISVKSVDRFILICVIAFVAVILIGVLKANHIF